MPAVPVEFRRHWRDLLGATIGLACGFACYSPITSLFFRALEREFGWSKAAAAVSLIGLPVTAACLPVAGLLIDRFGLRAVTLSSAGLLAASFLWLSRMDGELGVFYAASIALAVLGCATGPIGYTRVIAARFVRSRGLALAIALMGVALTGVVMPLLVAPVIAHEGWRAAYRLLALIAAGGGALAFLLIRRAPARTQATTVTEAEEPGLSLIQALARPAFWALGLAIFLISAAGLGFVSQFQSIAVEHGASPAGAAFMLSGLAGAVAASRLAVGFSLDRANPRRVAAGAIWLSAAGLGLALVPHSPMVLVAALVGFGIGAELDVLSFFCAREFGVRHYGAVYGALAAFYYAGLAGGGLLYAVVHDRTGAYAGAIALSAGMMAAAGLLFLFMGREARVGERRAALLEA